MIIALSPDLVATASLDQPDGNPQARALDADAAFHQIADAEFPADVLQIALTQLVDEGRVPGDNKEFPETR